MFTSKTILFLNQAAIDVPQNKSLFHLSLSFFRHHIMHLHDYYHHLRPFNYSLLDMMQPIPCLPGNIEPSQLVQVRSIFLHDVTDALVNFIFKYY